MIPDEIIRRRRIPPAYGYRMPHSEIIDQQDPSFLDLDGYYNHVVDTNTFENTRSNGTDHGESQRVVYEGTSSSSSSTKSTKLFPGNYAHRIDADRSMIALDIKKYLSNNHVNPIGNSGCFENLRRLARYSHSF